PISCATGCLESFLCHRIGQRIGTPETILDGVLGLLLRLLRLTGLLTVLRLLRLGLGCSGLRGLLLIPWGIDCLFRCTAGEHQSRDDRTCQQGPSGGEESSARRRTVGSHTHHVVVTSVLSDGTSRNHRLVDFSCPRITVYCGTRRSRPPHVSRPPSWRRCG